MTPEQEAELIEGFLSRQPQAELRFIDAFRLLIHSEQRIRWPGLFSRLDDLEQAALLKLCELRETDPESIRGPLATLAKTLMDGPARKLSRERPMLPLEDWDAPIAPSQETVFEIKRLAAIGETLSPALAEAIACHVAFVLGDGPPLHIALGVSENTARMRLTRAQEAVWEIAEEEENEVEND